MPQRRMHTAKHDTSNGSDEPVQAPAPVLENEEMAAKAGSTIKMYVAAGLFGVFLLIIFVSIAIRIERNLRVIADRP
jgi:hypothetical protein